MDQIWRGLLPNESGPAAADREGKRTAPPIDAIHAIDAIDAIDVRDSPAPDAIAAIDAIDAIDACAAIAARDSSAQRFEVKASGLVFGLTAVICAPTGSHADDEASFGHADAEGTAGHRQHV